MTQQDATAKTEQDATTKALNDWPEKPPFDYTLLLPLVDKNGDIKGHNNLSVKTKHNKTEKTVTFTIEFTIKDGTKVPKDAGPQ